MWHRLFFLSLLLLPNALLAEIDAKERVREAIEYWRDSSSFTVASMIIHRPDWRREMELEGWTRGMEHSLVRFIAPARDSGNSTLKVKDEMWSFSPKVNRVIKIPASMMTQSWMGSDFSYNDLAKADDIVRRYTHKVLEVTAEDGKEVVVVEAIPHEDAPVVWGKEILHVREDKIVMKHIFFDQEFEPVKQMVVRKVDLLGGKLYPVTVRMEDLEEQDKWTEFSYSKGEFGTKIPDYLFTLSNLRNPRR